MRAAREDAARERTRRGTGRDRAQGGAQRIMYLNNAEGLRYLARAPAHHSGMFPCFLAGFRSRLVRSVAERVDQPRPGVARVDHVVDVAPRGGGVRVGELLGVLVDQPRRRRRGISAPGDLVLEQDLDRALGSHHRDLRRRPGQVQVAPDVLGAHDVVGAAVGLAGDDGELGHRRLAVGVQQLGAVLDDPAMLLGHARQEPRHVDEGDDRAG